MSNGNAGSGVAKRYVSTALVHLAVAALLATAAFFKTLQLSGEPVTGTGLLDNRHVQLLTIQAEIALAGWLLSGIARRAAAWTAMCAFVVFAAITTSRFIAGESSCGCFGNIQIPPLIMLTVDVLAFMALFVTRPAPAATTPGGGIRKLAVSAVAAAAIVTATVGVLRYRPARLTADGLVRGEDVNVLLEPETWIGSRLPLAGHLDVHEPLLRGRWTAVMYHHNCRECVGLIDGLARKAAEEGIAAGVVLIEVPPYGQSAWKHDPAGVGFLRARLDASRNWFVATPTVLELDGGVVTRVRAAKADRQRDGILAALPALAVAERMHDLGHIEPASRHAVAYRINNAGPTAMAILGAASECPCLTVLSSPASITAGGSGLVRVEFVAPDEPSADYVKRVMVRTDDPKRPSIPLTVRARIGSPIVAQPAVLDLGPMLPGEQRTGIVELVNTGSRPVRPVYCTSSLAGSIALIPRRTIPAAGRLEIPVRVTAGEQAAGRQQAGLLIRTDSEFQPEISATVQFDVQAEMRLSRGSIELGVCVPGESKTVTVEVTASAAVTGFVTGAELVGLEGLSGAASLTESGGRAEAACVLQVAGPGRLSGTLRLRLAGRDVPVDIPITGTAVGAAGN